MRGRGMEQRDPCGAQLWAGIMVSLPELPALGELPLSQCSTRCGVLGQQLCLAACPNKPVL